MRGYTRNPLLLFPLHHSRVVLSRCRRQLKSFENSVPGAVVIVSRNSQLTEQVEAAHRT